MGGRVASLGNNPYKGREQGALLNELRQNLNSLRRSRNENKIQQLSGNIRQIRQVLNARERRKGVELTSDIPF